MNVVFFYGLPSVHLQERKEEKKEREDASLVILYAWTFGSWQSPRPISTLGKTSWSAQSPMRHTVIAGYVWGRVAYAVLPRSVVLVEL